MPHGTAPARPVLRRLVWFSFFFFFFFNLKLILSSSFFNIFCILILFFAFYISLESSLRILQFYASVFEVFQCLMYCFFPLCMCAMLSRLGRVSVKNWRSIREAWRSSCTRSATHIFEHLYTWDCRQVDFSPASSVVKPKQCMLSLYFPYIKWWDKIT